MDPAKSATAPPSDWSGEKSTMGQPAPPPYQDSPHPYQQQLGYPPQQPGYPPQGFGAPPQQYGGYGQPFPGQQTVTVQPAQYVTQPQPEHPINDYLCYSIFNMLCCCLPLGVAALIYSISAREANHVGDWMAAERSSRTARTLNHIGLGIGIGVIVLCIIYGVVVASLASR
ncbi:synapse differentiation-inducing gene protein 1-like isoform X2 [Cheilinus undulatus]|uniref:synapse differentiation-inducing gene protein 1-like isoform X2 n=1 Tax=Cheilinus undulatus TaxID=241271 RepID=UPI001BD4EB20|nr:synapse differentiation-inducing gene protein 1-like isoform X2 [Cheilinus undulatus]